MSGFLPWLLDDHWIISTLLFPQLVIAWALYFGQAAKAVWGCLSLVACCVLKAVASR